MWLVSKKTNQVPLPRSQDANKNEAPTNRLCIRYTVLTAIVLLYLPACNPDKDVPRWILKIVSPLDRFVAWIESKQLGAVWMKIIGALWAFFIYLVTVYIGGQLAMAVVVALIYDVLTWATMQV